jgi:protein-disulfide isomerase
MSEENITVKKSTFNKLLVSFVVVVVVLSFAAGFIMGGGSGSITGAVVAGGAINAQQQAQQQQQAATRVQVSAEDDSVLGDANAKITVVQFSDYECPFCERFYTQTEGQLIKDYVDTGKIRFVYRDFPLEQLHAEAFPAALASECAHEQGKFWEYHNKLFENQQSLSSDNYKKWAADLGLDTAKFNSCYDSKKYESEVQKDTQDGGAAGVQGTPTFFIGNDQKGYIQLVGAQPYATLKAAIDSELAG